MPIVYAIVAALLLALLVLAARFGIPAIARRPEPDGSSPSEEMIRHQAANEHILKGIESLSATLGLAQGMASHWKIQAPSGISRLSSQDRDRMVRLLAQLEAPNADIFPLRFRYPLPVGCEWLIDLCPAMAHPGSGLIFAVKVGTYLNFLRLTGDARSKALAAGAVWIRHPIPNLAKYEPVALFGDDWVIPNMAHPRIRNWLMVAFRQAGEAS